MTLAAWPRRRLVFALTTVLLVSVAVVAAFEIGLRWSYEKIERITGASEWEVARGAGLTYFWDVYHPRFGLVQELRVTGRDPLVHH